MNIELSIITINYNGLDDTCALIDTIPFDRMALEVIVVDNGSARDEAQQIAQRHPHVKVVRSERNLGFAGGNNLGINAAQGDCLLLINNDTLLGLGGETPDETAAGLRRLIERLHTSTQTAIVCPKLRYTWGTKPIQFAGFTPLSRITLRNRTIGQGEEDQGQYDTPHTTPYAHGAAMMVKRSAIEQVGLMPECFFLYYEELDWSVQMTRQGYDIWYDPALTVYHKESQATGQDSALKAYYMTRNRLLLARRTVERPLRYATYLYLCGLVAPRDVARHALHGRHAQARAVLRGLRDFACRRYALPTYK